MSELVILLVVQYISAALIFVAVALVAKGVWWKRMFIALLAAALAYFVLDVALTHLWRIWIGGQAVSAVK